MAGPFETTPPAIKCLNPDSTGPDVLFIHGAWHGAWCLADLGQDVADLGWRVHLLDLPGHGDEPWPLPAATSIGHYAQYVGRCVESIGRPALVGHSLGGWIIQKILERHDLPAALICPLPGGGLPLDGLARFMLRYPVDMTGVLLGRPLTIKNEAMARRLFFRDLAEPEVRANLRRMVAEPARVALDMGFGLVKAKPAPGSSPRLVLAAEHDFFISPAALTRLARRLGAKLTILPGMPHNPWLEDPNGLVLKALAGFLEQAAPQK